MNADTKNTETELIHSAKLVEDNPIPQDGEARKAWLDEAWAERGRHGLE